MLRSRPFIQILFVIVLLFSRGAGQANPKTLAERLGYPADARLLIVHADDLGVTHSVNAAAIDVFKTGVVNSGSMMVPCPWFPEIADYFRNFRKPWTWHHHAFLKLRIISAAILTRTLDSI